MSTRPLMIAMLAALVAAPAWAQTPTRNPPYAMGVDPCYPVRDVTHVPAKPGVPSGDRQYDALFNTRRILRECLAELIVDETPMPDPREEPTRVDGFVRGDLAFFLLSDFELTPFKDVLPETVRAELPSRGVRAYFDWIKQPGQRRWLRDQVKAWQAAHPATAR